MSIEHDWIRVVDAGEYLKFQSRRCSGPLKAGYLGSESGDPSFRFACEHCRTEETCKAEGALWSGLPPAAA